MDKTGPQKLGDGQGVLTVAEVLDLGRKGVALKLESFAMASKELYERVGPFGVLVVTDEEYEGMKEIGPVEFDISMQKIMIENYLRNGKKYDTTWNVAGVQKYEQAMAHIVTLVEEVKETLNA